MAGLTIFLKIFKINIIPKCPKLIATKMLYS